VSAGGAEDNSPRREPGDQVDLDSEPRRGDHKQKNFGPIPQKQSSAARFAGLVFRGWLDPRAHARGYYLPRLPR
jgi:hypothetical protein